MGDLKNKGKTICSRFVRRATVWKKITGLMIVVVTVFFFQNVNSRFELVEPHRVTGDGSLNQKKFRFC